MRILLVLALSLSGISTAKVSINPESAKVLVNQCFVFNAHFSTQTTLVREINVASSNERVLAFAKPDCSGGTSMTIPGNQVDFAFSVLPTQRATKGNYGLTFSANAESARVKVMVEGSPK